MSAFQALSAAAVKGFLRDKVSLFFTFAFPLMFIVIFGLVFGNAGTEQLTVGLVGEGPAVTGLKASGAFEFERFDDFDEAIQKVRDGDLPGAILARGTEIELRFAASDQTAAATIRGITSGVVDSLNVMASGQPPTFKLSSQQVEDSSLKPIQFIGPGMMSWGVAIGAVFGSAFTLVTWRKKQVLRRIRSAPVSIFTVLSSRLVTSIAIGVVQMVIFIGVAMLPLFGFKLSGSWWLSIPVLVMGVIAFFAVGLVIGAICKTEEAASGVANALIVPMAFLSGVFIPLDAAPGWMRSIANFMPLKHMNDGMVDFLVRGQGPGAMVLPCAVLLALTLVMAFVASRVFNWEAA